MPVAEFQSEMQNCLRRIYPEPTPIQTEWQAIQGNNNLYSPRIDIVVGPFSTTRGGNRITEYNQLMDSSQRFIEALLEIHQTNYRNIMGETIARTTSFDDLKTFNENARCLLAIEIENKVSRKHLLGGVVNASALGRMGIVVGWTGDKVKALFKLLAYWEFLGSVGKNSFRTNNLIILSPSQLQDAIET